MYICVILGLHTIEFILDAFRCYDVMRARAPHSWAFARFHFENEMLSPWIWLLGSIAIHRYTRNSDRHLWFRGEAEKVDVCWSRWDWNVKWKVVQLSPLPPPTAQKHTYITYINPNRYWIPFQEQSDVPASISFSFLVFDFICVGLGRCDLLGRYFVQKMCAADDRNARDTHKSIRNGMDEISNIRDEQRRTAGNLYTQVDASFAIDESHRWGRDFGMKIM